MNNISTKAALFLFDAKSKFGKAKDYLGRKAKSIVKEENGDTNFISNEDVKLQLLSLIIGIKND